MPQVPKVRPKFRPNVTNHECDQLKGEPAGVEVTSKDLCDMAVLKRS